MSTAVERLLSTAAAEVGYLEKKTNAQPNDKTANAGSANFTKYARDLDKLKFYNGPKNGFAWCAVFADWCFVEAFGLETALKMTGQSLGGYGAGCGESVRYYQKIGRFYRYNPQAGDQIFFADGKGGMAHTGLVERVSGGRVYTIEGNTGGASGVVANGGGVCRKSYSLGYSRIAGYGRPNYELMEEMTMTGKEIYDALQGYLKEQAVPDWAGEELEEAVKLGITDGSNPCQLVPRYQAAIMAMRALGKK